MIVSDKRRTSYVNVVRYKLLQLNLVNIEQRTESEDVLGLVCAHRSASARRVEHILLSLSKWREAAGANASRILEVPLVGRCLAGL